MIGMTAEEMLLFGEKSKGNDDSSLTDILLLFEMFLNIEFELGVT